MATSPCGSRMGEAKRLCTGSAALKQLHHSTTRCIVGRPDCRARLDAIAVIALIMGYATQPRDNRANIAVIAVNHAIIMAIITVIALPRGDDNPDPNDKMTKIPLDPILSLPLSLPPLRRGWPGTAAARLGTGTGTAPAWVGKAARLSGAARDRDGGSAARDGDGAGVGGEAAPPPSLP
uniref:Uncharacterized protein n=1 Tax=Oryza sativa subsp. japonica TaxID=39947 RepID=Q69XP6_ORYSJ|nr:hypothetical protein [Oryza sativa Japonica Group]